MDNQQSSLPPKDHRPFVELNWEDIKGRIKELLFYMPQFLKHPVEGMKRVPSWDWPTVLLLEILLAAATGFLGGVVARHIIAILGSLIVGPIMGLIVSFIVSGILYYACLFLLKTELEFRKVFIVVVLANIPSQILGILLPLAKPISLICVILSSFLIVVGLAENFMLDKRKVSKIVFSIAGIFILFWFYSAIMDATTSHIRVQDYTPESLDQIHKELSEGK